MRVIRSVAIASRCRAMSSSGKVQRKPLGPGPLEGTAKAAYPAAPCWSCDQVFNPTNHLFCKGCKKIQPATTVQSYFALLNVPVSLVVDRELLERNFQSLQKRIHPDMYASKTPREQQIASQRSQEASEAYTTLRDPLARAKYFLAMQGVEMETLSLNDPQLLAEVMDEQEQLMELEMLLQQKRGEGEGGAANVGGDSKSLLSEQQKETLRRKVSQYEVAVEESLLMADGLFKNHSSAADVLTPVTHLVVRAQYFQKLAQDCADLLEKAGNTHHLL